MDVFVRDVSTTTPDAHPCRSRRGSVCHFGRRSYAGAGAGALRVDALAAGRWPHRLPGLEQPVQAWPTRPTSAALAHSSVGDTALKRSGGSVRNTQAGKK